MKNSNVKNKNSINTTNIEIIGVDKNIDKIGSFAFSNYWIISITVFFTIGFLVLIVRSNLNKRQKSKSAQKALDKLSDKNYQYEINKSIIEDAIQEQDWETLEDMLRNSYSLKEEFPDLVDMIKKALKN